MNKIHLDNCLMWLNSEIRHLRKQLRTLCRRYNRQPMHISKRITCNSLENTLQDKISFARQNFECHLVNSYASTSSNKIFRYLKSIIKSNNIPLVMSFDSSSADTDYSTANLFNHYFHSVFHDSSFLPNIEDMPEVHDPLSDISRCLRSPRFSRCSKISWYGQNFSQSSQKLCWSHICEPLHHLFTQSLCYALLPRCWKIHKVLPVFKSGDSNCVKNYRPISLLFIVSKDLYSIK